jgi:ParB-like chromosome segregation protein Spo0J
MAAAQTGTHEIKFAEDEVKHLSLREIYYDPDWNARSSHNVMKEGDIVTHDSDGDQGLATGLSGLAEGIATDGQLTPVWVRPVPKEMAKKAGDKSYHLVAGARRFFAITRLNADAERVKKAATEGRSVVPNTGNGTIRAIVKPMAETEALVANLQENTDRCQLNTPDLALGVHRLDQLKMPQAVIATRLGISQSHVSNLARIVKDLQPSIFKHWREGGEFQGENFGIKHVALADMSEIARLAKDKQIEGYLSFLGSKKSEKDTKLPVLAAIKRAKAIGVMLGTLQKEGFIEITDKPWVEAVEHVIKLNKATKKTRAKQRIADGLEKAFQDELARDDTKKNGDEEEEEDDE